ncbi:MAG: hypothetical protein J4432_00885 [DPANN group archaeon]|nr:hypothetical protein [DPANN group archaeon]
MKQKIKQLINVIVVSGVAAFLASASSQFILSGTGEIDYTQAVITTAIFIIIFFFFEQAKARGKV